MLIGQEFAPECLLAFSRGKDSIATWLALQDAGFTAIHAHHCYIVPDLEFVEESLGYFERVFGVKIRRVPHPSLHRWLNNEVFTTPDMRAAIDASRLPNFDYTDLYQAIREDYCGGAGLMTATGVRACDSPIRRIAFNRRGGINRAKGEFWPIADWNKARTMARIAKAGIKLPVDYDLWGRSFDGLDYRFMKPMKDKLPRDYARVLEWFPLLEAEMWRYERL